LRAFKLHGFNLERFASLKGYRRTHIHKPSPSGSCYRTGLLLWDTVPCNSIASLVKHIGVRRAVLFSRLMALPRHFAPVRPVESEPRIAIGRRVNFGKVDTRRAR